MDHGHEYGTPENGLDDRLENLRRRFEELLGNADGCVVLAFALLIEGLRLRPAQTTETFPAGLKRRLSRVFTIPSLHSFILSILLYYVPPNFMVRSLHIYMLLHT